MRIIAGKHRGANLLELKYEGTRPTADRVREALFSKLQNEMIESTVLDLFAGTGALGFEALSRGAKLAYLVDKSKDAYNLILKNNEKLKENAVILNLDFKNALKKIADEKLKFDIIFIDPPYASSLGEESIKIIADNNLLKENGTIVFEHNKDKIGFTLPEGFKIYDEKKYGIVYLTFITNE
ncbi:MAG: 16S rRNA (guanine(966)-N(2))-methyltransferase RsmD [Spirochaetales bacterium]